MTTPLDSWAARRVGSTAPTPLRADIERHQLRQLRRTLAWAASRSPYYRRHLGETPAVASLADLAALPFTTADDLRREPGQFLCIDQGSIRRIVTLDSSGTAGMPKRLFFTARDQRVTVDYFEHGLASLVAPRDQVLVLFPGRCPGSVGDLLAQAIRRLGGLPAGLDLVADPAASISPTAEVIIGPPLQVLAATRRRDAARPRPPPLKSVLLCSDNVPRCLAGDLRARCGCAVFEAYAMTEMGLGGGVQCPAHDGYHLQEPDLLFEIVDPADGRLLPDGVTGEVVFTTLSRSGMPLIRYRTGDLARFLAGPCACGGGLRRLDRIQGRVDAQVRLAEGCGLSMPQLDDVLLADPAVANFTAGLLPGHPPTLQIRLARAEGAADGDDACVERARRSLHGLPAIDRPCRHGQLALMVEIAGEGIAFTREKRRITGGAP